MTTPNEPMPHELDLLTTEIERLRVVLEAARHLRTQSRKQSLWCFWSCKNIQALFAALEAADAAGGV